MEIEYFVPPHEDEEHFEKWKQDSINWWLNEL